MEGHEYNSIVLSLEKIFQGNAENQFSYDDIIQAHVDNRVGAVPVAFRVFANNEIGRGEPSKPSNLITFEDPF